jgi:hypothetical protein
MDLFKPPEALCKSEPPASHKTNQKPIFFYYLIIRSQIMAVQVDEIDFVP